MYVDGFVIPVNAARREEFVAHANRMDPHFLARGARRVVEAWGADISPGKLTDFRRAVQANESEAVAFAWIEWPDKATRDAAFQALEADAAMMAEPMPFDGKRMIFGGFEAVVSHGAPRPGDYVQGFVIPVPEGRKSDYFKLADEAWPLFAGYGATAVVEAWGDDVPDGKQTDFYRAVNAEPGEKIVFSYMTWPSRDVCDAAAEKMRDDPAMQMPEDMPFDGERMIWGGFEPVVELGA
ncbi:MAG: DUF1428 domain-containing protein [Cypionkella sp.]